MERVECAAASCGRLNDTEVIAWHRSNRNRSAPLCSSRIRCSSISTCSRLRAFLPGFPERPRQTTCGSTMFRAIRATSGPTRSLSARVLPLRRSIWPAPSRRVPWPTCRSAPTRASPCPACSWQISAPPWPCSPTPLTAILLPSSASARSRAPRAKPRARST